MKKFDNDNNNNNNNKNKNKNEKEIIYYSYDYDKDKDSFFRIESNKVKIPDWKKYSDEFVVEFLKTHFNEKNLPSLKQYPFVMRQFLKETLIEFVKVFQEDIYDWFEKVNNDYNLQKKFIKKQIRDKFIRVSELRKEIPANYDNIFIFIYSWQLNSTPAVESRHVNACPESLKAKGIKKIENKSNDTPSIKTIFSDEQIEERLNDEMRFKRLPSLKKFKDSNNVDDINYQQFHKEALITFLRQYQRTQAGDFIANLSHTSCAQIEYFIDTTMTSNEFIALCVTHYGDIFSFIHNVGVNKTPTEKSKFFSFTLEDDISELKKSGKMKSLVEQIYRYAAKNNEATSSTTQNIILPDKSTTMDAEIKINIPSSTNIINKIDEAKVPVKISEDKIEVKPNSEDKIEVKPNSDYKIDEDKVPVKISEDKTEDKTEDKIEVEPNSEDKTEVKPNSDVISDNVIYIKPNNIISYTEAATVGESSFSYVWESACFYAASIINFYATPFGADATPFAADIMPSGGGGGGLPPDDPCPWCKLILLLIAGGMLTYTVYSAYQQKKLVQDVIDKWVVDSRAVAEVLVNQRADLVIEEQFITNAHIIKQKEGEPLKVVLGQQLTADPIQIKQFAVYPVNALTQSKNFSAFSQVYREKYKEYGIIYITPETATILPDYLSVVNVPSEVYSPYGPILTYILTLIDALTIPLIERFIALPFVRDLPWDDIGMAYQTMSSGLYLYEIYYSVSFWIKNNLGFVLVEFDKNVGKYIDPSLLNFIPEIFL